MIALSAYNFTFSGDSITLNGLEQLSKINEFPCYVLKTFYSTVGCQSPKKMRDIFFWVVS